MVIVALSGFWTLHLRTDSAQLRFRGGVAQDAKELSDKLTEQLSSSEYFA